MLGNMGKIYFLYQIERWFFEHHFYFFATIIKHFIRLAYSCEIPYKARIGKGTSFPHAALGVVLNEEAVIGENCKILHGVTIGGRGGKGRVGAPLIGNNVLIGCHAQILGPIKIGDNVVIGGGTIVIKDVPDNCTVVGNPARIISD